MLVRPNIELFDLKNPRLQHIYNKEIDDLEKSFADMKMQVEPKIYKFEIMLCLWFAVNKGTLEEA